VVVRPADKHFLGVYRDVVSCYCANSGARVTVRPTLSSLGLCVIY
jgi:hypothetical protein